MGNIEMTKLVCAVAVAALMQWAMVAAQVRGTTMPPPPQLGNFSEDFLPTWGFDKVKIMENGRQLQLSLDCFSGSEVKSNNEYLFANIDVQIKLVPMDSAGTVTSYYLSSPSLEQNGLSFEFLGNESGEPYIVQTNVFANGVGGREQQIYPWFDPTNDFHTYTIFWTPQLVVFLVDRTPIRVFKKIDGQPYLDKQAMGLYLSIWNGDNWATRGGLVKMNLAHAPFVTSFRNFEVKPAPIPPPIDYTKLSWVKKTYMVYDYCLDHSRYPSMPIDCL